MIVTSLSWIFVRYARKPIHLPTANSKLFRIAEHTFYSKDEIKQIDLIHTSYVSQEKSIANFMKYEFYIPATQSGGLPEAFVERETVLDEKLLAENEAENAKVALLKKEYLDKQFAELEDKVIQSKLDKEDKLMSKAAEVREILKDPPYKFLTPENIEAMIDEAMQNPISYEYSIDRSGRKY